MLVECQTRFSLQKDLEQDDGDLLLVLLQRKWYSISEYCPQGEWDKMAELMLLEFAESRHPIFRAPSPLSRGRPKSKGNGKLSMHCCADLETIETFAKSFLQISSVFTD